MTKEKDYFFNVKIDIELVTYATSEKQARASLREDIADYFANSEIEITKEEAILVKVK